MTYSGISPMNVVSVRVRGLSSLIFARLPYWARCVIKLIHRDCWCYATKLSILGVDGQNDCGMGKIWSHGGGLGCAKAAIRLQVSHSHPWTWACMRGKMQLKPAPPLIAMQNIDAY